MQTGATVYSLGTRYKNASLARWIAPEKAQKEVNDWLKKQKHFLVVLGNPGCGKTYLCASILNFFYEQGEEVYFTNHRRFMNMIQKSISDGVPQHTAIEKISSKNILIIDDIGSATNTDWQVEMILDLIDTRYNNELPTIITTNLREQKIEEVLGERTKSRMFSAENTIINIQTNDMRKETEM